MEKLNLKMILRLLQQEWYVAYYHNYFTYLIEETDVTRLLNIWDEWTQPKRERCHRMEKRIS